MLTAGRSGTEKNGRFGARVVVAVADAVNVTETASQKGTQRTAGGRARKNSGVPTRRGEDLDEGVFDRAVLALTDSSKPNKASTPKGRRPSSTDVDLVSALANLTTRKNASNARGEVEPNAGDPRGKRQVGKNVVAWLSRGMSQMATELLDESSSLQARVREPNFSLVLAAQQYLWRNNQPMGEEAKCQVAATHLPTLWDHLQREVRIILSREGSPEKNEAWRKVKALAWRPEHKASARKGTPAAAPSLGPTREQLRAVQARVDEFVKKASELLEIERAAEVEATKRALDGAEMPVEEEDRDNSLRKIVVVRSYTGLGGQHLAQLRSVGPPGKKLPPSAISPGDLVYLRPEGSAGPGWGEEMRGTVQSLGQDGATISIALEKRHGDPATAKLFGRVLRVDRVRELADGVTYERNLAALKALQKGGVKAPAARVIRTLFGDGLNIVEAPGGIPQPTSQTPNPTTPTEAEPETPPNTAPKLKLLLKESQSRKGGVRHPEADFDYLDESQQGAVRKALDREGAVTVIQGPPGTGKTVVVCDIIAKAVARGERVLATAPTNAAVDNMVEKLSTMGLNVVRVGNPQRMTPAVTSRALQVQVDAELADWRRDMARRRADVREDMRACAQDEEMVAGLKTMLRKMGRTLKTTERQTVKLILSQAQVVLCTNSGAADSLVQNEGPFDMVVVDEAGQATEPSCWIPLLQGKRAILAGDTCQLAPTVLSREAMEGGLAVSLMERAMSLYQGRLHSMLQVQYRMNAAIADWSSVELYNGQVRSAPMVANKVLADKPGVASTPTTLAPLLLLDTRAPRGSLLRGCEESLDGSGSGSLFNEGEATIVVSHVLELLAAGVPGPAIAVQSPYLAQVELLQARLAQHKGTEGVEVASIDSFQGREADAVIISMVRSNPSGIVGFLGDHRRMNVGVTRARMHVAVVCDSSTVGRNPFLLRLLQHIKRRGEVRSAAGGDPQGSEYAPPLPMSKWKGQGNGLYTSN
ncbi:DNA helicase [Klebsormidium nitens]|uniref:DNA helicase n=1 Tax=Klebsormidium nitens TaxID=105231 RepID=A0A1Y1IE20_KLENI|nr:DNA helicase [Klebsormidium nitens]|eukprot:GAQ86967.1 DNA helicase [Klebsormidium nitens]